MKFADGMVDLVFHSGRIFMCQRSIPLPKSIITSMRMNEFKVSMHILYESLKNDVYSPDSVLEITPDWEVLAIIFLGWSGFWKHLSNQRHT